VSAIISLILIWIIGRNSLLSWSVGNLFTVAYLAWAWIFWRRIKPVVAEGVRGGQAPPNPRWMALLEGWLYLVFGGGLLLSLVGYGSLSNQWFFSWIKLVALLFWGWISLKAIREWRREHRASAASVVGDQPRTLAHQWRWSLIMLVWAAWLTCIAAGLLWTLDSFGLLKAQLGHLLNLSLAVGSLNLSIKGVLLAGIILFITHGIVRIGRTFLNEKLLQRQPWEQGLKDSILTITSYLAWGLGLLLALSILGVNATSLAVVFGALSIGIGFGLQNIFNNFISGLILLFERPIQVGDFVEVNGIWAEVKQINVRATVVQTFDNASVIIPNSEFISQQVTNWSFKDRRMRRNIEVGVAYGSDIDLVEKTLLEIVQQKKKVLKFPKPDVLFTDHADSALIFRLRIWVQVEDYWEVPSKIRFDIDHRFRELGIEIAFPQRDLHIRSLPEDQKWPASAVPEN
jgi:small-conductance mechanosensitive channel